VILAGVEGPDHTYKLPSNIQKNIQQIAELYRADPQVRNVIPDFLRLVRPLLSQLEKAPVVAEVTDPQTKLRVTVTVGKLDLLFLIAGMPGRLEIIKQFPSIAYRMTRGDFSKLAELSLALRRDSMSSAMAYMMDCASGASPERLARIRTEEKTTLVGRLNDFPFPEVCEVWGSPDLGAPFRAPLRSSIPALFISGTLDGRTPVSNVEEIRQGFPNSWHLIVEGAGHVDERFFSIRTQQLMLEFLKGKRIFITRIMLPPLEFSPITSEEGK
jgi:pimeloyl-ACP methyl ester carboxylesterase